MKIVLLREAGGIGDVIRTASVAKMLRSKLGTKYPDMKIIGVGLGSFEYLYSHLKYYDDFVPINIDLQKERRARTELIDPVRFPYLKVLDYIAPDMTVNLFCPAYNYEIQCKEIPEKSRSEKFCDVTGLDYKGEDIRPEWVVTPLEDELATKQVSDLRKGKPLVAVHFKARCPARSYPDAYIQKLLFLVKMRGEFEVLYLDDRTPQFELFGAKYLKGLTIPQTAAILTKIDYAVTIDSGILHLTGALGVRTLCLYGPTHHSNIAKHYPTHVSTRPLGYGEIKIGCAYPCFYTMQKGFKEDCREKHCGWINLQPPEVIYQLIMRGVNERSFGSSTVLPPSSDAQMVLASPQQGQVT